MKIEARTAVSVLFQDSKTPVIQSTRWVRHIKLIYSLIGYKELYPNNALGSKFILLVFETEQDVKDWKMYIF